MKTYAGLHRTTIAFLVFVGVMAVFASEASAKVYLDINNPGGRRLPIAVPSFIVLEGTDPAGAASEMAAVIAGDLKFSGFFEPVPAEKFIEDPRKKALTREEIHFPDWTAVGAEALIKGGIRLAGPRMEIEIRLFDAVQGRMIVGKKYTGEIRDARRIAHRFSNEVFKAFTGEDGIFDTQIAFVRREKDHSQIFIADYDGANAAPVLSGKEINLKPRWHPDGKRLAYTSYKRRNPDLYEVDVASGREKLLSGYTGLNLGGAWSPKGDSIALTLSRDGNSEIYLLDPLAGSLSRLTQHSAIDVSPAWSPDGSRIAFVSDRSGSPQIYVMDASGENVRRITFEGSYNTSPAWSPRGDKIAFTARRGGAFQIAVVNPDGTDLKILTNNGASHEDPTWSPDGRYLSFSSRRNGRHQINIMPAQPGIAPLAITSKGTNLTPAWSPRRP